MLNLIIFSKNRACQLELLLRSMKFYFKEFNDTKINILYTYSNDKFREGYEKLFEIHNDKNINYIKEVKNFKEHVLLLLDIKNRYTIFFVDDIVFKNYFSIESDKFRIFQNRDDILTLSLRLHPYLTYCYPARVNMNSPKFDKDLVFDWYNQPFGDYGYPMSLDGHFFRTPEIYSLTKMLNFNNPNSYESELSYHPFNRPRMICFEESIIVNNPINKVQNFNNNVHGTIDSEYINEKFLNDYIIDLENFKGIKNLSCHQETEINFIDG